MDQIESPDQRISHTIRLARVLCIYFMMLVHVPPGFDSYAHAAKQEPGVFSLLQVFFTGILGRSSVPLLSVVSGYLAVASLSRAGYLPYAWRRFTTLYLPTIFWNALLVLFSIIAFEVLGNRTSAYDTIAKLDPAQLVFGAILTLDYSGITVALRFLRDLFVCGLLLPLLILPARKAPISSLILLILVSSLGWLQPLIYRPAIVQFFYLGLILHFNRGLLTSAPHHARWIYAALVLASGVYGLMFFGLLPSDLFRVGSTDVFTTVRQAVVASAMWCFCFWLVGTRLAERITPFERTVFLSYLSHVFVFGIAWFAWKTVVGREPDGVAYPLFFFGAPLALLLIAPVVDKALLVKLPPFLQIFIKGKATAVGKAPGADRAPPPQP